MELRNAYVIVRKSSGAINKAYGSVYCAHNNILDVFLPLLGFLKTSYHMVCLLLLPGTWHLCFSEKMNMLETMYMTYALISSTRHIRPIKIDPCFLLMCLLINGLCHNHVLTSIYWILMARSKVEFFFTQDWPFNYPKLTIQF